MYNAGTGYQHLGGQYHNAVMCPEDLRLQSSRHPGQTHYHVEQTLFSYTPADRVDQYTSCLTSSSSSSSYSLLPATSLARELPFFDPSSFVRRGWVGQFIGQATVLWPYVRQGYQALFSKVFPDSISVSLLNRKQFADVAPNPATVGLSMNRSKYGLPSHIILLEDMLARILLTFGHELGHVLSPTLPNDLDEEAKAYAFSIVWMETIAKHNIAGLRDAYVPQLPAQNGLHDVAYNWVRKACKHESPMQVWRLLVGKQLSMTS